MSVTQLRIVACVQHPTSRQLSQREKSRSTVRLCHGAEPGLPFATLTAERAQRTPRAIRILPIVDEAVTDPGDSELHHYRLFGGVLASDVEIPELERVQPGPATWSLYSAVGSPAESNGEELGSDVVTGDVRVRLYRQPAGFRLVFDDTGCFDISAAGDRISWTHQADVSMRNARADLTSRVLAAALHAAGTVCLHGSAVVASGQAFGFLAPKFHGKSTLALALVRSGAKLLTDDTLPVMPGATPLACPGLHATRLWADSAARVGIGSAHESKEGEKMLFSSLPPEHVTHDASPLTALYLLAPTRTPQDGAVVWRTRLSPIESTLSLIGHAKLASLLTRSEAPVLFRAATALTAAVPVYRLNVVRDLERLPEVIDTIRSWHSRDQAAVSR